MAIIISKPEFLNKGEDNVLKISRSAIKALPTVSNHFYFRKYRNWKHIALNFFSVTENQIEVVLFTPDIEEPEAILSVSPRAINEFQIESIVLHDFDNGWLTIPREELDSVEFDFVFDSRLAQPELTVNLQNKSNAILTWTQAEESDSSTEYIIYRKIDSGEYSILANVVGSLTYTDTGLQPDTSYTYKVEISDLDKYRPSTDQGDTVTPTRPDSPVNLTSTTTPGQVTLSWSSVAGQGITYRVYRSSGGQQPSLIFSDLTGTSYTDNTVVNGTTYSYTVKSYDGFESNPSSQNTVKPLGTFSITGFTSTGTNSATLSWSPAAGADSYTVFYRKQGDPSYSQINSSSPHSFTGLSENSTYEAYVTAQNAYSSYSTNPSTAEMPKQPSAPQGVSATSWEDSSSTVTWSSVEYAERYFIYRSTGEAGPYTKIAETTLLTYQSTGLSNGATYYFKIAAVNDEAGLEIISPQSSSASGTPNIPTMQVNGGTVSYISMNTPGSMISKLTLTLYNSSGTQIGHWESTSGVSSFSHPDQSLPMATPYSVVGKAFFTDGRTMSDISFFNTQAIACANLTASGTSVVNLNWSPPSGNNTYDILRSTNSNMSGSDTIGSVTSSSFVDNTPYTGGTTYYYAIRTWMNSWNGTAPSGWTFSGGYSGSSSEISNIASVSR